MSTYFSLRDFLIAFGVKADRVLEILPLDYQKQTDPFLYGVVKVWLKDPITRRVYGRIKPAKAYVELSIEEKHVFNYLVKERPFFWLNEHFGLTLVKGDDNLVRFAQRIERDEFKLPESVRKELLKTLKRFL